MGQVGYIQAVASLGYKTEGAATAIVQQIDPVSGQRAAVRAFGFTAGATATSAYFMQTQGETTVKTKILSGATTGVVLTGEPISTNALASNDYIGIMLDTGKMHVSKVATGTYSMLSLTTATTGDAAAGNAVYFFGAYGDTGHVRVLCAASAQTARANDGGIVYGAGKGWPMLVWHNNDAAAAGSQDYVAVDYINK
jgi:hypothetical protein